MWIGLFWPGAAELIWSEIKFPSVTAAATAASSGSPLPAVGLPLQSTDRIGVSTVSAVQCNATKTSRIQRGWVTVAVEPGARAMMRGAACLVNIQDEYCMAGALGIMQATIQSGPARFLTEILTGS